MTIAVYSRHSSRHFNSVHTVSPMKLNKRFNFCNQYILLHSQFFMPLARINHHSKHYTCIENCESFDYDFGLQ